MKTRKCKCCGTLFIPKCSRHWYCNKDIIRKCKLCGKEFITQCCKDSPEYCSRACAGKAMVFKEYTCVLCGDKFHPGSSRQKYCKKPIHKIYPVCEEDFTYPCGPIEPETCDKLECKHKFAHQRSVEAYQKEIRVCAWPECGKEFHPVNNTQKYCTDQHYRECKVCGKKFPVDVSKGVDIRTTCSDECRARWMSLNHPFKDPANLEKYQQTCLKKYGVRFPAQSSEIQEKTKLRYLAKTGYIHPSHNPEVRSRSVRSAKFNSKLEEHVGNLLEQYHINYIKHYMISTEVASHEFDFYIPDYKILVDCDGVYYHGYLSDPNGTHVIACYDEDRISLIPHNHVFHVIVEGEEEKDIKYLVDIIKSIDNGVFNYESDLFLWCRSIGFPFPNYLDKRMLSDFESLRKYTCDKYNPYSRLGDSIIQQFHHSIYDSHVDNYPSPREAWDNDKLLKKVILNRLIYKNNVDPFKILRGFNISKICPRVSVFNPVLAKYIVTNYLSEFDTVFDPFSGFSGRLLGTSASDKHYIGQDLNSRAVEESNNIIQFLKLENCGVTCKDVLQSSGSYECLMTCPPYDKKEHYADEIIFKNCDEWIDECLARFKCRRYVFVVDTTEKYKEFIEEEIKSTSHFVKLKELLVVIDR